MLDTIDQPDVLVSYAFVFLTIIGEIWNSMLFVAQSKFAIDEHTKP